MHHYSEQHYTTNNYVLFSEYVKSVIWRLHSCIGYSPITVVPFIPLRSVALPVISYVLFLIEHRGITPLHMRQNNISFEDYKQHIVEVPVHKENITRYRY